MRALVTGSRGFVGQHLVRELMKLPDCSSIMGICRSNREKNHRSFNGATSFEYSELGCDIEDEQQVLFMLSSYKPDIIFHLAANPLVKLSKEDPLGKKLWRTNVEGTHNLLAHAPLGCRFVFASSASVYGDMANTAACHEDQNPVPSSLYGASKLAGEGLVQAYTGLGKVRGVILRYVANVGIGSTHGVVHDFIRKLRAGYPKLDVIGDKPGSTKPYIYVKDTARATIQLGLSPHGGVWNVSTNNSMSIKDLAEATMQSLGIIKDINWLGWGANWVGDNRLVRVSNCKLKAAGWKPMFAYSGDAVRNAVREIACFTTQESSK